MLRRHDLHAMAVPGRRGDPDALPACLFRLGHIVSRIDSSRDPARGADPWRELSPADGRCASLFYGSFCIITFVWVHFYVPETKGVPLGRAMDAVFGVEDEGELVDETSALLQNERVRKASFSSLHEAVV
jgi:hypothetical protein